MRIQTERRLRYVVQGTLGGFFLSFAWRLVEDAILGWINTRIAEQSGMSDFSIQEAYPVLIDYGPVVFLMALAFGTVWVTYRLARVGIPETASNGSLDKQSEPSDSYISLEEAATIAYEETRGTRVAAIAERISDDNVLAYYAYALFNGTTTLYGNHPPSRKLEAIPNEERGRCGFSNDLQALRRHGKNRNLYENLQIKRSDLNRRIAELKSAETERHAVRNAVRMSDALYWIIDNSGWVSEFGRDSFLDLAENVLRQAARDEEITIRGRREISRLGAGDRFDQTWEDIEPSYWRTHKFEMTAVMCAEPHYAACETAAVSPMDITAELMRHYAMLRVWNDELERLWPAANGRNGR